MSNMSILQQFVWFLWLCSNIQTVAMFSFKISHLTIFAGANVAGQAPISASAEPEAEICVF